MHKILFLFFLLFFNVFGTTYDFALLGSTPLNFGNQATGITANMPNPISTACATLNATPGVLKLRVNGTGGGPQLPVTINWIRPATLDNGPVSIPLTITIGLCRRTNVGNLVGASSALTGTYTWTPNSKDNLTRDWIYGTGTIVVPPMTPFGVYTGNILITGTY